MAPDHFSVCFQRIRTLSYITSVYLSELNVDAIFLSSVPSAFHPQSVTQLLSLVLHLT